ALRGKVVEADGRLAVSLGDDTLPGSVRKGLGAGTFRRVLVIGQGTAAVAGQILAATLASVLPPSAGGTVTALPASELSGFGLDDDMGDTLVIAISQSGTTTDTNRTVDLVRARGAAVLAVVNRRNSDLVEKADGVLYTSDGRDVEMSVASTKAFYAQVAAGFLLSLAIAREVGGSNGRLEHELLSGLRDLPAALEEVLAARPQIAECSWADAPSRQRWGYETAQAQAAQARGPSENRPGMGRMVADGEATAEHLRIRLAPQVGPGGRAFTDGIRDGAYNGDLDASTAFELDSVLRHGTS